MQRTVLAVLLLGAPVWSAAADALQVAQIEQDIRRLQQQLQEQARQIEALRLQLLQRAPQPGPLPSAPPPPPPAQPAWLDASLWMQVRPGMGELEVIALLGPPTSMRSADNGRVLLYAMEIGASGFLGGSITLRNGVVTEVQIPRLR